MRGGAESRWNHRGPPSRGHNWPGGPLGLVLLLAVMAAAAAQYAAGPAVIPVAWLAVGPLLASLVLSPRVTVALAAWALLLAAGLDAGEHGRPGMLAWHLSVCLLLAAFAVPEAVTAARLASRYVSAAAESRVGGDLLEVIPDAARPRWLIGDARGKGLPAVRLASVAMTSFRDACARPGLDLPEIARVVDQSVTRTGPAPTACWKHATGPAATFGPSTAWTRCVTQTFRRPRTGCWTG